MTVEECIEEPMQSLTDWSKHERKDRIAELITEVGLTEDHLSRPLISSAAANNSALVSLEHSVSNRNSWSPTNQRAPST